MEIDDAVLVDLVRQFPFLYDKGNKDFKDKNMKENSWSTIAANLHVDGEYFYSQPTVYSIRCSDFTVNTAQTIWIVLRNKYSVERKKEKTVPSGSGARKSWPLFSAMSFLDKHMTMRK